MSKVSAKVLDNPVQWAIAAAVVAGIAYFAVKKLAGAVGGVVSGNNTITKDTPYAGAGIVATPAAIADSASGGLLSSLGGWIGRSV